MSGIPRGADDARRLTSLAGSMIPRSRPRVHLAGFAALALTVPLLAGCQAFGINEQYGARYADLGDMESSWDAVRIPELVPADATDIRIGYNTIDEGAMLGFASEGGITAHYCEAGQVEGTPVFEPGWWPESELPDDGWVCGDWSVVEVGGDYLVWD